MSGVVLRSAVEMLAMLRARKVSPLELAEEHIRQIDRLNPQLNALIDFDADRVRAQAAALDRAGRVPGILCGLPMSVKASISVAGHRCETGSLLNQGHIPATDAIIVSRMRQAGAVVLGTTNCPEFLMAYETDNCLYGRTSNPWTWDGRRGDRAAVNLRLSQLASRRVALAVTAVDRCGARALYWHLRAEADASRIPGDGHLPPCVGHFRCSANGAHESKMYGCSFAYSRAPPTLTLSAPIPLRQHSQRDLQRVPIGFFEDDGLTPVTTETRQAVRSAVDSLRRQGFRVEPFRPCALEEARALWWKLFVRCGTMLVDRMIAGLQAVLSPILEDFLRIAHVEATLSGEELLTAWVDCDRVRGKLLTEMCQYPVLLMPVCSVPAFRHGEREWNVGAQTVAYLDAIYPMIQFARRTGCRHSRRAIARESANWDSDCRLTISGRTCARNCCRSGEGLRLSGTAAGRLLRSEHAAPPGLTDQLIAKRFRKELAFSRSVWCNIRIVKCALAHLERGKNARSLAAKFHHYQLYFVCRRIYVGRPHSY